MSSEALVITAEITLPSADLVWTAVRASGPGGQNVNKVSSKVALRFGLAHNYVTRPPAAGSSGASA